jgi:hypothetical protein
MTLMTKEEARAYLKAQEPKRAEEKRQHAEQVQAELLRRANRGPIASFVLRHMKTA